MQVVIAAVKAVMGRKTKPSTLAYAPQPAIASAPKALILLCTTTLAMEIMEFCTPEGIPWPAICRSMGRSNRIRRKTTRSGPVERSSLKKHSAALTAWLITVAIAAPATPI